MARKICDEEMPDTQIIPRFGHAIKHGVCLNKPTYKEYSQLSECIRLVVVTSISTRYSSRLRVYLENNNGPFCISRKTSTTISHSERTYQQYKGTYNITTPSSVNIMVRELCCEFYDKVRRLFDNQIWERKTTRAIFFNVEIDIKLDQVNFKDSITCIVNGGMYINYVIE